MTYNVITKIKQCLPVLTDLATRTLSFIEKEVLDVPEGIIRNVKKSGNKIIIEFTLPGVNKDDLDFICNETGFNLEIKVREQASPTS